jgi:hypothetical protein
MHKTNREVLRVMILIVRVHMQNEPLCFACQSIFNVNSISCEVVGVNMDEAESVGLRGMYCIIYQLTRKMNHFVMRGGPQ